jgi:hypothetical protein
MPRTRIAFVVAPLTGSLLYWWFETVEHLRRTGVMPSQNLGFLGFISIFAFVGTALLALPVYLLLRRYNLLKNSTILFAGTLIGWLLISFSDDGRLWEHPEGFVTGIVAGFTFLLVRGKCVSQDGRS